MTLLVCLSCSLLTLGSTTQESEMQVSHGPFLGHAGPGSARVWARASEEGEFDLQVVAPDGGASTLRRATALAKNDLTLSWELEGLAPGQEYSYRILHDGQSIGELSRLRAGPADDSDRVKIAFASCANEKRFPKQAGWGRILEEGAEALVLLGDMPYIDSTELAVQRRRYREFYSVPEIALALGTVPFYATWDDHDFGRNDTDGQLPGKENSRQAFIENHANPSYGNGETGIYCNFRRGPVEVFLLDARTFAGTQPSPIDPEKPTLLGSLQWAWLRESLAASTAPFKVLATGMIWNGATRPGKRDHWMTYPYERQAIFDFLGTNQISGVVLVGGDIHRSRALRYPTEDSVGYQLTELITSPLANTVIESANAPSPHLLHDVGEQETFLLLEANMESTPPSLVGTCMNAAGKSLFVVELDLTGLTAN
jgi:alkaline phosphatase D